MPSFKHIYTVLPLAEKFKQVGTYTEGLKLTNFSSCANNVAKPLGMFTY
jgi:hypothetical protein